MDTFKLTNFMLFLSTLSLRRATTSSTVIVILRKNFYPRSPCGERQRANSLPHAPPQISIHALLAESDVTIMQNIIFVTRFLSTLSLRRATINTYHRIFGEGISIHALLAESDVASLLAVGRTGYFYPRSPQGAVSYTHLTLPTTERV